MPTPGQMNRIATVSGSAEGCAKVQEIINRIIVEQSSQFVMTGVAFQSNGGQYGYGQQQQYGQQYGAAATGQQPDYSAQWAAYYASQAAAQNGGGAATNTADATQSNAVSASAAADTASSSANPAPDAYYDAFYRYSYHYGEEAARKYYGAWSPPEGSANPYGTNPNLASTTSSPAPSAAPVPAQGQVRDSSVRNVSNLPAWMTKS